MAVARRQRRQRRQPVRRVEHVPAEREVLRLAAGVDERAQPAEVRRGVVHAGARECVAVLEIRDRGVEPAHQLPAGLGPAGIRHAVYVMPSTHVRAPRDMVAWLAGALLAQVLARWLRRWRGSARGPRRSTRALAGEDSAAAMLQRAGDHVVAR